MPSGNAEASGSGSTQPVKRITRDRNGCLVCRTRRVKCDLGRPSCTRCINYGAQCEYAPLLRIPTGRQGLPALTPTEPEPSRIEPQDTPITKSPPSPENRNVKVSTVTVLDPVDRLLAMCRATRIGSYWAQPADPPAFLQAVFPDKHDMQCFHHCVTYALYVIVTQENKNPWIVHVAPLLFKTISCPLATQALRLAMLRIGAVHLSYLQGQHGQSKEGNATRAMASKYRDQCCAVLRLAAADEKEMRDPAFFAACALLLTSDLLSAEPKWRQVLRLTRQSIAKLGGCAAILFVDGRVMQPAMKCAIESIVFLSVAATLTSGESHSILGARDLGDMDDMWWLALSDAENLQPELSVFETSCGISRSLIMIFANMISHLPHPSQLQPSLTPSNIEFDLTSWRILDTLETVPGRVRAGSLAFWYAARILLSRHIYRRSPEDEATKEAALGILTLSGTLGDKIEYLNLPVMIACSVLISEEDRNQARELLKAFTVQCCYELDVVQAVCEEMWLRMDIGEDQACPWREILIESGFPVLLG